MKWNEAWQGIREWYEKCHENRSKKHDKTERSSKPDHAGKRITTWLGKWSEKLKIKGNPLYLLCVLVFCISVTGLLGYEISTWIRNAKSRAVAKQLQAEREKGQAENDKTKEVPETFYDDRGFPAAGIAVFFATIQPEKLPAAEEKTYLPPEILPEYRELYETNQDMIGWLKIEDTVIDYPVMQTPEDEDFYLTVNFYKEPDKNGCLLMDTDSHVGSGTAACDYQDGERPSTNLIIHGHTMKSGAMFGGLKKYAKEDYGKEHSKICFDSLYEKREYELISVFYSQVYYQTDQVFKYYKFFQADIQEEFDDWYDNIKEMSLYDTGITAEFGDEFLTLSCCAYHVEDGRFVVVAKRVK